MIALAVFIKLLLSAVLVQSEPTCQNMSHVHVCYDQGVIIEVTEPIPESGAQTEDLNIVSIQNLDNITSIRPGAFKNISVHNLYLALGGPQLNLEPGVFSGLPKLVTINIMDTNVKLVPNLFRDAHQISMLTLMNNKINHIPDGTFSGLSSLTWLLLNDNDILAINKTTLEGLSRLQYLYLDTNKIASIANGAFADLGELWRLDLYSNQLTEIQTETFRGLTKLYRVALHHNKITTIYPRAFFGLTSLAVLELNDNEISDIRAGAFEGLSEIKQITLFNNRIHVLPAGLFAGLSELSTLYLAGNPLSEVTRADLQSANSTKVYFTYEEPDVYES